jgi:hypothetical protein
LNVTVVGLVADPGRVEVEGFAGNTSILDLVDTAVRALGRLDPRAIPGLLHTGQSACPLEAFWWSCS